MTRALLTLVALATIAPVALAQQLPPPQNPAGDAPEPAPPRGPALIPPQPAQAQPPRPALAAPPLARTPDELRASVAARRQAERDRKQARIDRMNQFKANRAAEEQKLYQDWHDRYLADAPVRVEYYRAQAAAAQSQPAVGWFTPSYFYAADSPLFFPPFYAPVVSTPIYYQPLNYGIVVSWGW